MLGVQAMEHLLKLACPSSAERGAWDDTHFKYTCI